MNCTDIATDTRKFIREECAKLYVFAVAMDYCMFSRDKNIGQVSIIIIDNLKTQL